MELVRADVGDLRLLTVSVWALSYAGEGAVISSSATDDKKDPSGGLVCHW